MTDEEILALQGRQIDPRLAAARECMANLVGAVRADGSPVADLLAAHMQGALVSHMRHLRRADPEAWAAGLTQIRAQRGTADAVRRLQTLTAFEVMTTTPADAYVPAGLPPRWSAPDRYNILRSGVWWAESEEQQIRISTRPIWVVGYLIDVDGRGHHLRLMWTQVDGTQHTEAVPLGSAMDARGLLSLARRGCPVTSSNARALTGYLDAGVAALQDRLPVEHCAGRLGWMPAAAGGSFLWGSQQLPETGQPVQLMADPAVQQVAASYTQAGSWAGWLAEVMEPASHSPALYLAVYASVASVLLQPLGVQHNYAIDYSGETSTGKTTVQRAAASVWGNPTGLLRSWAISAAGLEAYASMAKHLPIILDDSKKARRPDDVAGLVYLHSGGTGAVRGKPGAAGQSVGLRRVETWRSWLISSGESRLVDFSRDAGTRARVLCWQGSPLDSADAAQCITLGTAEHYGHLGPLVVRQVALMGAEELQAWLADALALWRGIMGQLDAPAVARRLADAIAVLDVAERLCITVGLPECRVSVMESAQRLALDAAAESDQPAEALRVLYDYCTQRQAQFQGRNPERVPAGGFLGRWDDGRDWQTLQVLPRVADELLRLHGFDLGIRARWVERGWVQPARDGGSTCRAMVGSARCRVLALRRSAFDAVGCV